jgi:hypothetical protein
LLSRRGFVVLVVGIRVCRQGFRSATFAFWLSLSPGSFYGDVRALETVLLGGNGLLLLGATFEILSRSPTAEISFQFS